MPAAALQVFAPAKVNLALHVTGRRADGYHLLDSLVTFAPVGDTVTIVPASGHSLTVEGPEAAGVPEDLDNLALRAAAIVLGDRGAALKLEKRLPAASGIGGGSSDAAAAVRGALELCGYQTGGTGPEILSDSRFAPLRALGADFPMCLSPRPLRARGIGDQLDFVDLPPLPAVLVNPRVAVSTPRVFGALKVRENPPMPETLPDFAGTDALIVWLAAQRNDMEHAARGIAPEIGTVLAALQGLPGCGLARMSGSGATCFGLFATEAEAEDATARLRHAYPDWWIACGVMGDLTGMSQPRPVG